MTTQVISTTELANIIAEQTKSTKKAAKETVQLVLDAITAQLVEGNTVRLSGFGTFEVKDVEARKGRNPSTGEEIDIAATKRVGFKSASALKAAVKGEAAE